MSSKNHADVDAKLRKVYDLIISLTLDEREYIRNAWRCTGCGHLNIFHDDELANCLLDGCECVALH